ncbi:alkaline phosphatase family protein [Streptomyces sp. NPDC004327]|uniref:alkaline phosphatase family protein n=1 Tax=Streptomyces sp. NPDC004327 TaxID=3364699 RepID=UPI00368FF6B9
MDTRPRSRRALGGLLAAALSACFAITGTAAQPAAAAPAVPTPDHVVVVMMENEPYDGIIGNTAQAPYLNSLAAQGASFSAANGEWHPSLPNYYALLSGSTQGLVNSTPPPVGSVDADNLPGQLATHGRSFADYSDEATPAAWLRFADLPGTATAPNPVDKWLTCPSPTPGQGCGFPADAAGYAALPTVTFVHGNEHESMHDGNVPGGDAWVRNTVGGYANWAKTHNSLLIVTWDEDDFQPANHIPTLVYGAGVKPGSYSEKTNHYNLLRTIEDMYGLPYLGNAAAAAPITDIWGSGPAVWRGPGPVTGYNNWCLDDRGSGTADLNPVVLYGCTGAANQQWTLPGDGTVHTLGKCLDVLRSGTANGTLVELYQCNGSGAQQWLAQPDGTLRNPQSGKCLDDPGSSLAGSQLIIWDCKATANQIWHLPA